MIARRRKSRRNNLPHWVNRAVVGDYLKHLLEGKKPPISDGERLLLQHQVRSLGLVNDEGALTPAGKRFLRDTNQLPVRRKAAASSRKKKAAPPTGPLAAGRLGNEVLPAMVEVADGLSGGQFHV